MKFAEESPWPDPLTLEEDVLLLKYKTGNVET